jgi:phenylacetate-CoA ligase
MADGHLREMWNEKMESVTADRLKDIHEDLLLRQIHYAAENSPFYRDKYNKAGVKTSHVRTMDDIAVLPFTEKKELREAQGSNPPVGRHRACGIEDLSRVYSSSGTTGMPTYIGLTSSDIHNVHAEAIARFCWAGGIRPDSVVVNIPTAPFIADTFREGIERTGAVHLPTGFNTDRVVSAFRYQGANGLHATISFWSYLLDEVEKQGINPRDLGLRRIVGGAEGGAKIVRARVEEGFGATATEGMGMGEQCCVIFGECAANRGSGMHYLGQGLVHVEIIDPESGRPLPIEKGVTGELVYSGLIHQAMPLLRYRSRDQVKVAATERCTCGRGGFRIEVLGRTDDMLTVLGVNVYPLAVKDVISTFRPRLSGQMEIWLDKPGPAVEPPLKVRAELGENPGDLRELKKLVEHEIRAKLIAQTSVELVEELPQYQYKSKLIHKAWEENG